MKRLLTVLMAALIALMPAALADEAPELLEPVGVKLDTAEVVRQDIYELKYYDATVAPYVEELSFTVDGEIDSINALAGDVAHKGDVLATLNQDDLIERAEELSAQIDYLTTELEFDQRDDQLELSMAQLELEQLRAGVASGEVTQQQVELKAADVDILRLSQQQQRELAEFEIASLQRQLDSVNEELGNNEIVAPFDGRLVYMELLQKGDQIKAYDVVYYIADDTRLYIDSAYISESSLAIANQLYARIGGANYDITPQEFDWREYVAIALAGGELRTGFDFADGVVLDGIESGQYAAVFMKTGLVEDALVVPANALYTDSEGRYVYKMEGDTRVRTEVTTGQSTTTLVEITEGLEEGDYVYVKE